MSDLQVIIKESGLEKTKADFILEKFKGYFSIVSEWEIKAKSIVVVDEKQTAEMGMARVGRLFLRDKRTDIEKARKELKEQSLREGKAIDGIANVLKGLIQPIEKYLDEQEHFVEVREEKRKEERKKERVKEVLSLGLEPDMYDLKNASEENYQSLIIGRKLEIQKKIDEEKRAEEERKKEVEEQKRIRLENERLKKEAELKEKQLARERAEAEAERKKIEEKNMQERNAQIAKAKEEHDKIEKQLAKEKEAKENLEREYQLKVEAEEATRRQLEEEEEQKQQAPDKEKLLSLLRQLQDIVIPELRNNKAKHVLSEVLIKITHVIEYIETETKKL